MLDVYMYPDGGFHDATVVGMMTGLIAIGVLVALALELTGYVLRAVSLHTMAKRRGIDRPWMAWLPVAGGWILGSLSDQYQYLVMCRKKSRRKVLLWLEAAVWGLGLVSLGMLVWMAVSVFMETGMGHYIDDQVVLSAILGPAMGLVCVALVWVGVVIAYTVFHYICMYDVYRSCNPNTAVAFLVISIVVPFIPIDAATIAGILLEPIFLMVDRRKDLGMPPRRQPEPPTYTGPEL